jgi:hypothetical protein
MSGQSKYGMECSEFELLLDDALEGKLERARQERFEAHRNTCPLCGPMYADTQTGRELLRSLEEVAPPVHLVHNILAATTGIESSRLRATTETGKTPLGERMRERWDEFFSPFSAFVRQPRFVMSFGMIFFSFSLALSAAGVKAKDVAKVDLHPKAIRHTYYDLQVRIVQYYENIRFVYEIESRVREFKRSTRPAEPGPAAPQNRKNNTSGQPDQKQDRNYAREEDQPVLAGMPGVGALTRQAPGRIEDEPPVATDIATRRFV